MSDLNFQDLLAVQSDKQPEPNTIASAATIAPTTRLSIITGTVAIANITPPTSGYCELLMVFTNAAPAALATTGNILTAYQPIQNRPFLIAYIKTLAKWYVMTVA